MPSISNISLQSHIYNQGASGGGTSSVNSYQNNSLNAFGDSITISGTRGSTFISPFTLKINTIIFYNQNAAGTHVPVQISLYQTADPLVNGPTFTKLGQTGDIACVTNGFKAATGLSVQIYQGYYYYMCFSKSGSGGGSTTPTLSGRATGANYVASNMSASDLSTATPATFTMDINANTIAGWTAGTANASSTWFMFFAS